VAYPIDDEAFFANPAFNRATHSFFRTTVVESVGTTYEGLSEQTYWIQPLHGLVLAGWANCSAHPSWHSALCRRSSVYSTCGVGS